MTSHESWGDLYFRLYPAKHLSELTLDELDLYYECIVANYNLMNNTEVRAQYIEDAVMSIDILQHQEGMQIHHLRFLLRLFFWASSTTEFSIVMTYLQ